MTGGAAQGVWRIWRLCHRRGRYFNSPQLESWRECGTCVAADEDAAAERARVIVGSESALRVELVSEWYKPESLA